MRKWLDIALLSIAVVAIAYGFLGATILKIRHWDMTELGLLYNYPTETLGHLGAWCFGMGCAYVWIATRTK